MTVQKRKFTPSWPTEAQNISVSVSLSLDASRAIGAAKGPFAGAAIGASAALGRLGQEATAHAGERTIGMIVCSQCAGPLDLPRRCDWQAQACARRALEHCEHAVRFDIGMFHLPQMLDALLAQLLGQLIGGERL